MGGGTHQGDAITVRLGQRRCLLKWANKKTALTHCAGQRGLRKTATESHSQLGALARIICIAIRKLHSINTSRLISNLIHIVQEVAKRMMFTNRHSGRKVTEIWGKSLLTNIWRSNHNHLPRDKITTHIAALVDPNIHEKDRNRIAVSVEGTNSVKRNQRGGLSQQPKELSAIKVRSTSMSCNSFRWSRKQSKLRKLCFKVSQNQDMEWSAKALNVRNRNLKFINMCLKKNLNPPSLNSKKLNRRKSNMLLKR